jgi:predicted MFS family arabinose efflux permease
MIVTYWYCMNGMQQIVGGLLAYLFSLPVVSSGKIASWQALFITLGCFSALWGVFVMLWMPDSAMSAKCFSEADKTLMIERVRGNQTGLQNRKWRTEQFKEALTDPQTYAYCLIALATTIPTSGLGSFANIIITENFQFDPLQTQLIAIPRGIAIIIILLSSTWLVNKTGQNLIVMAIYVIPSFIGTAILMTVKNESMATKVGLLISYHVVLTFWAAQGLAMSMISRNVAGQTKKSITVAANFVSWAIGNAIGNWPFNFSPQKLTLPGPQVFLAWNGPTYFIAFATHMGCYTLLIIVILSLRFHLKNENRLKDAFDISSDLSDGAQDMAHAFDDLTDRENPAFRYIY